MKKAMAIGSLLLSLAFPVFAQAPMKVVFINPGMSSEAYWQMVSAFMKSAARDLNIELEIVYAERDHLKQVALAQEVAQRSPKPDYVICVNEKLVAPQTIAPLDKAGIKTFLILNDLSAEQKKSEGPPRGNHHRWIGTLVPDNVAAGHLIAEKLTAEARRLFKSGIDLVALNGVKATPAAAEREEGLGLFLKANPDVKLEQIVNTDWTFDEGYSRAKLLLSRYPKLNVMWCANDLMALGAVKALRESGRVPGKDVLVAGLNWSADGVKAVKAGELVATIGGHFMTGGWALVLMHDYHHGLDFSKDGLEMKIPGFSSVDAANVDAYLHDLGDQNWGKIDFARFSKKSNPNLKKYDFSLKAVLAAIK